VWGLGGGEGRGSFLSLVSCGRWFASTLLVCDNISKAKTGAQRAGVFFCLMTRFSFFDDREPREILCHVCVCARASWWLGARGDRGATSLPRDRRHRAHTDSYVFVYFDIILVV